jgi:lipopolysaccharide export system protein LptA
VIGAFSKRSASSVIWGLFLLGGSTAVGEQPPKVTVSFSADQTEVIRQGDSFLKRYTGNVVVRFNSREWLTANRAVFDAAANASWLTGSVVVQDSGRVLRADRVTYLFRDHPLAGGTPLILLQGSVVIEDSTRRISALRAEYRQEADNFVAFGEVRAREGANVLNADSVWFVAKTRSFKSRGNVELRDTTKQMTVRSGSYDYNGRDSVALVTASPIFTRGHSDTAITVSADTLALDARRRLASAWGIARIGRGNLHATCDSVAYDDAKGKIGLFGYPHAIHRQPNDTAVSVSRLWGDRITLSLSSMKLRRIEISGSARVTTSEEDSTTAAPPPERWMSGSNIVFEVDDGEVTEATVWGRARSRYEPAQHAREQEGTNEAAGDTIRMSFHRGKVAKVRLKGGVHGVFLQRRNDRESARAGNGVEGPTRAR